MGLLPRLTQQLPPAKCHFMTGVSINNLFDRFVRGGPPPLTPPPGAGNYFWYLTLAFFVFTRERTAWKGWGTSRGRVQIR